jgi:hypothetical protein
MSMKLEQTANKPSTHEMCNDTTLKSLKTALANGSSPQNYSLIPPNKPLN